MTFTTFSEFETSFKKALEIGQHKLAAKMILDNQAGAGWNGDGLSQWWIAWAKRVRSGGDAPFLPKVEQLPPLKQDDLFGEPLTNGKTLRKTRKTAEAFD